MALPLASPSPYRCNQIDRTFSFQLMSYSICKKISWIAEVVPQSRRACNNIVVSRVIDAKREDIDPRTSQVKDVNGINLNTQTLSKEGRLKQAVGNLYLLNHEGIFPDCNAYASVLQMCTDVKSLTEGMWVHTHMIKTGLKPVLYLENNLLSMYIKCGNLPMARQVFDKMPKRDNVSWAAMISGYAQTELAKDVLYIFHEMQRAGINTNEFTFVSVLKVCAVLEALEQGKQIHASIIKKELDSNVYLCSVLVDLYAKCGCLADARQVFDALLERDVVSWTAMISGYVQQGHDEALKLFYEMQRAGVDPNKFTFSSVLRACAGLEVLDKGRQFHSHVIKAGFESNVYVASALVDMYAKCGNLVDARQVFDEMSERDMVSWTALIVGYEQHGYGEEALILFYQMRRAGMQLDEFIITSALSACRSLPALQHGKHIHGCIIRCGFYLNTYVGSVIIHMYANCGRIEDARKVFDRMHEQDMVARTAMLAGYSKHGHGKEAFQIFEEMQCAGLELDQFACSCVLSLCANQASLELGKQVHACMIRNGYESDMIAGAALIDMYAKSGSVEEARKIFDGMCQLDVVSWNAMIVGYSKHGDGKEALRLFEAMQRSGMKPDEITFVGILSACSHAGLVDEAWYHFNSMNRNHCVVPKADHYACMVDLLGRAGRLNEAYDLILKMPFDPDAAVWGALLSASRVHDNMDLATIAAERLYELEPQKSGLYVVLSNMYAAAGRWADVVKVRKEMKERGVMKEPGCSWIEVNNEVHTFLVGDRSHPQTKDIYTALDKLSRQIKAAGYVPDTNFVLHDVEEEQKEDILSRHSEKLAIVFGLISTPPGTCIRIVKNLRVCGDCHVVTKFISKVVEREIILRDINRFHRFKDGLCSCGDYW